MTGPILESVAGTHGRFFGEPLAVEKGAVDAVQILDGEEAFSLGNPAVLAADRGGRNANAAVGFAANDHLRPTHLESVLAIGPFWTTRRTSIFDFRFQIADSRFQIRRLRLKLYSAKSNSERTNPFAVASALQSAICNLKSTYGLPPGTTGTTTGRDSAPVTTLNIGLTDSRTGGGRRRRLPDS